MKVFLGLATDCERSSLTPEAGREDIILLVSTLLVLSIVSASLKGILGI